MTDRKEVFSKLEEIFEHQVFELHISQTGSAYIPYMMNDAIECYLELENCRITGRYLPDLQGKMTYSIIEHEGSYAMIVRQTEENVFTLWFDDIEENLSCYQYHQIGHFWVKGGEQWRQLVYMIGTVYDKFRYLGEAVCNEQEIELLPLMEFAPFRMWSPIRESLDDSYPDTWQGTEVMKSLATQAGCKKLAILIGLYEKIPTPFLTRLVAGHLRKAEGERLYHLIRNKVIRASEHYETRNYGEELNKAICTGRQKAEEQLKEKGFSGTYPYFEKGNIRIMVAEEHPFTILEAEDFHFRIQFMVSEGSRCKGINSGFFRGFGRSGRIEKNLDFLG